MEVSDRWAATRHSPPVLSRRNLLRIAAVGIGLALAGCGSDSPAPVPGPDWGAFIPEVVSNGSSREPLQKLAALAGAPPRYVHRFAAIGDALPVADLDAVVAFGATPLLTLEPWVPGAGVDQPRYALSRIAAGDFDGELRRRGSRLKRGSRLTQWGKPLILRFAQEMNGT